MRSVTPSPELENALRAAAEAHAAYVEADEIRTALRGVRALAFREARAEGATFRAIAAVTGLTFQRVKDIVDPRERPRRPVDPYEI